MLVLEDLLIDGLKIYQDDTLYRFTSDAVLLSRFAVAKKNDNVADFCAGSGIVGLNFYALNKNLVDSVTLFEMQTPLYELSKKSIEFNRLNDKFWAVNTRLQDIGNEFNEKFSLILCNPPYMQKKAGLEGELAHIDICKREVTLSLTELINVASKCLKFGGRFCMVHRADRLADAICQMRAFNIEPKRLQMVQAKDKAPYLFMIEGVKGGKSGLKVLTNALN